MRVKARNLLLAVLVVGVGLVGTAESIFLIQGHRETSQRVAEIAPDRIEDPIKGISNDEIETSSTEAGRINSNGADLQQLSEKLDQKLGSLQSQLTRLGRKQESIVRDIDKITSVGLNGWQELQEDEEAATLELTPEEKLEQEEAQTQAQVQLLEQTLLAETIDPTWTSTAQLALDEAFMGEEKTGFELVGKECRTSMCRLEFNLDGSASPDQSFHSLIRLRPWQGSGFALVDDDGGSAVVYLAREGHSLPQWQQ